MVVDLTTGFLDETNKPGMKHPWPVRDPTFHCMCCFASSCRLAVIGADPTSTWPILPSGAENAVAFSSGCVRKAVLSAKKDLRASHLLRNSTSLGRPPKTQISTLPFQIPMHVANRR